MYNDLYKFVRDPLCYVADCWDEGSWVMDFRRTLSLQEYNSWLGLLDDLKDSALTDNKADVVVWALERKMIFSTKSLYRFLTDRGATSRVAGYIWRSKVPLKINFFLWQMVNNKLQVAMNQVKKKWKGDINCCLCGCVESVDHVFFQCHLARLVWCIIREVYHLENAPTSLNEFTSAWLMGKGPLPIRLIIFFFAGFSWTLWNARNKMAIEKEFLKVPD